MCDALAFSQAAHKVSGVHQTHATPPCFLRLVTPIISDKCTPAGTQKRARKAQHRIGSSSMPWEGQGMGCFALRHQEVKGGKHPPVHQPLPTGEGRDLARLHRAVATAIAT